MSSLIKIEEPDTPPDSPSKEMNTTEEDEDEHPDEEMELENLKLEHEVYKNITKQQLDTAQEEVRVWRNRCMELERSLALMMRNAAESHPDVEFMCSVGNCHKEVFSRSVNFLQHVRMKHIQNNGCTTPDGKSKDTRPRTPRSPR